MRCCRTSGLVFMLSAVWFLAACGATKDGADDASFPEPDARKRDAKAAAPPDATTAPPDATPVPRDAAKAKSDAPMLAPDPDAGASPPPLACSDAGPSPAPSCAGGGPGRSDCGGCDESCCTTLPVPGGTYFRTYDPIGSGGTSTTLAPDGGPADEADPASVSDFQLDAYEVTVGRFRSFVAAVYPSDGGVGWRPTVGAGKHPVHDGRGVEDAPDAGTYESGWTSTEDDDFAPTDANLGVGLAGLECGTWTSKPGEHERLPINMVTFDEAYAFCIWDGGYLPTDAEWEYAAAGGSAQREYPWGSTPPGTENEYAIYGCYYPDGTGNCPAIANVKSFAPVGTARLGVGAWGQFDLAGNVSEWTMDWFWPVYPDPCDDCAALTPYQQDLSRSSRGSDAVTPGAPYVTPPDRNVVEGPTGRYCSIGIRCARAADSTRRGPDAGSGSPK